MKINKLSVFLIGGVLLAVAVYTGVLLFLTWPVSELTIDRSGIFGDSFGPLTSLFSGLAFAGLIITIVMQKDELGLQREELSLTRSELSEQKEELRIQNETLSIQRFENTFFRMLEFLEGCRKDVFCQDFQSNSLQGRDAIKRLYEVFTKQYLHGYNNINGVMEPYFKHESNSIEGIKNEYRNFYQKKYGEELGQYFRTLYNILKLIDSNASLSDKTLYANLLRAQLSRYELSLLFYNCLSEYGEVKMAPLIKRYSILKHLEESSLPDQNIEIWREFNA